MRRATQQAQGVRLKFSISIHALLAESDASLRVIFSSAPVFLSTLSLRRATGILGRRLWDLQQFLSTLSLRRATGDGFALVDILPISIHALLAESDSGNPETHRPCAISIHALLAESDPDRVSETLVPRQFLSTLSLRRATRLGAIHDTQINISIHALLAESDHYDNYNLHCVEISIHALLAESDHTCQYFFSNI